MNYMAKIAEMLGVGLGEVFCMNHKHFSLRLREYKITSEGFWVSMPYSEEWVHLASEDFELLFSGKVELIKRPWKPKRSEKYWTIYAGYTTEPVAGSLHWVGSVEDLMYYKNGCVYRTKEECERNKKSDYEKLTGEKWKW